MRARGNRVHDQVADAVTAAAVKASPPLAVVTAAIAGLSLQTWVYVATLAYTVLQISHLVFRWVRDWRARDGSLKPTVPPAKE